MRASSVLTSGVTPEGQTPNQARRLVVTWQHPVSRAIEPVALLTFDGERYRFAYLQNATSVKDFRPLLGFPVLEQTYESEALFPLFAQRVMDPRRPDYERYVARLGLEDDASPWEQIARSQGRRQGDTIQLFPEPVITGDHLLCRFLVHGSRHVPDRPVVLAGKSVRVSSDDLERALAGLGPGSPLQLVAEPANPVNSEAIVTATADGVPIGWVPNLLVHDLQTLLGKTDVSVSVEHVNGPDAPWHLRVLAGLEALVPDGFRFFAGSQWRVLSDEPTS